MTSTDFGPFPFQADSLVTLLRARAQVQSDQIVFCFESAREPVTHHLTFGALDQTARCLAAHLQTIAQAGDRVLLFYPPGLDFITAFMGCLYAGLPAVPLYPPRPRQKWLHVRKVIADCGARLALTNTTVAERLPEPPSDQPLRLINTDHLVLDTAPAWLPPAMHCDGPNQALAFLQYTSGSTGKPKGVLVSHNNLMSNQWVIGEAFQTTSKDVAVNWLPLYHDMGLIGTVLHALFRGFRSVLLPPTDFTRDPFCWLRAITNHGGTLAGAPNFAYELLSGRADVDHLRGLDLRSWRVAFNGAEPIRAASLQAFATAFAPVGFQARAFFPCYGMAEATLFIAGSPLQKEPQWPRFEREALSQNHATPADDGEMLVGCGAVARGHLLRIVDPAGRKALPEGHIGEIWFAGPSVARGYQGQAALTEATFAATLTDDQTYLRTGDLGFLWDSQLFITGRLKDVIIIRGRNYYPQDLERCVEAAHGSLRPNGSVAFSVPHEGGERLVLVLELTRHALLKDGTQRVPETVREAIAADFALRVDTVVLVKQGAVPRTSSGKVQRAACREMYLGGRLPTVAVADLPAQAAFETEWPELEAGHALRGGQALREWLCLAAARALNLPRAAVPPDSRLTELGLDSLAAVSLSHQLEAALGMRLPLENLLEGPSIESLAVMLEAAQPIQPCADHAAPHTNALSDNQMGLWLTSELAPDQAVYNLPMLFAIHGTVDGPALKRAMTTLFTRHKALRTAFPADANGPFRHVLPADTHFYEERDISAHNPEAVRELLHQTAAQAFDLQRQAPFRVHLFRCATDHYLLLMNAHHIAVDLWSLLILADALRQLYPAELAGDPLELEQAGREYDHFVAQRAAWLNSEAGREAAAFWRAHLVDGTRVLELPADYPRGANQRFQGASHAFTLQGPTIAGLTYFARTHETTNFTVLLTAFHCLLARYSGQDEVWIGSPSSGRGEAAFAELVGYLVNPVVMTADLSDNPTFDQLIARQSAIVRSALTHQDYPFQRLVDELPGERDPARAALFQVMFVLQKAQRFQDAAALSTREAGARLALGGLAMESMAAPFRAAPFELTLTLVETSDGFNASLEYNTDLFRPATAVRIAGHYAHLLQAALSNPTVGVKDLALMRDDEREHLLHQWNDTVGTYPEQATVDGLFTSGAARWGDAIALRDGATGQQLSYAGLARESDQLAAILRGLGVVLETRVAFLRGDSLDTALAALAILKAGGVYLGLDPTHPPARLKVMLRDADAKVLLYRGDSQQGPANDLTADVAGLIAQDLSDLPVLGNAFRPANHGADNLAYLNYTSGSTGEPKAVQVKHRGVVRLVCATDYLDFKPAQRIAQAANIAFDAATFELWGALLNGGLLIGVAGDTVPNPRLFSALLQRERVDVLFLTTALFNQFALEVPDGLNSLDAVLFGGERVEVGLVARIMAVGGPRRLLHMYGPTENTTYSSWYPVAGQLGFTVPIGGPIAQSTLYVVDTRLHPVPVGVHGELLVGGAGLARGYHKRPDLTAAVFIPNPFSKTAGSRLYRSGDLVYRLPDGAVVFVGRRDGQLKLRGHRIETGEIEMLLADHPNVTRALVRPMGPAGDQLTAYVTGEIADSTSLRDWLAARLPAYMVPLHYLVLPDFPLTPNGKIDTRALPQPKREGDRQAKLSGTETMLAGIWGEMLGVREVGPNDSFFELGGHSLSAAKVLTRVNQVFGVTVPLKTLFEKPRLVDFAAWLDGERRRDQIPAAPIVRLEPASGYPLSFEQERLWFLDRMGMAGGVYNLPLAIRLKGRLDGDALAQALALVVARHEGLRTGFRGEPGGGASVVLLDEAMLELKLVDWRGLALDIGYQNVSSGLAGAAFDLTNGMLIRAHLFRLTDSEHQLLLCLHHIISDAWSLHLLLDDLATHYNNRILGKSKDTPPKSPIRHVDYAAWQRQNTQAGARSLAFWERQLADASFVLELPTDRPRPKVAGYRGAQHRFSLDAEAGRAVNHCGRGRGVTPYMTLLGAFGFILSRYTGQDDLLIGSPTAGRTRAEVARVIGFFANTLVMRVKAQPRSSFNVLLDHLRDFTLDALAHQETPFERVVARLQPPRDLSRSPLFQVLFSLENTASNGTGEAWRGLEVDTQPVDTGFARFDLSMYVWPQGEGLAGVLEYNTDLFDAATMARLADRYQALLTALIQAPDQPLSEFSVVSEAERELLLHTWNDTHTPLPAGDILPGAFEASVGVMGSAVALIDGEQHLTREMLNRAADHLAHRLAQEGAGPEVMIGILLDRGPNLLIALLAVLKTGAAYVPLDPAYPPARLAQYLSDAKAPLVITEPIHRGLLAESETRVLCLDGGNIPSETPEKLKRVEDPGHIAYVLFTSGSTGRPKGVAITRGGVSAMLNWARGRFSQSLAHVAAVTSVCFDLSVFELFLPLSADGCVVLLRDALEVSTVKAPISLLNTVPSAAAELLRCQGIPPSVRTINLAGERLDGGLAAALYQLPHVCEIYNLYGPSEDTTYSTYAALSRDESAPPIGKPLDNSRVYLLDGNFQLAPPGCVGELCLAGAGLARGYLHQAALTAASFVPDPFSETSGSRLYRTGDLARWRRDGELVFLGRRDHLVKPRGFRVELGEIEAALLALAQVTEAAVVVRSIGQARDQLIAYLVGEGDLIALAREHLAQRLPAYMLPSHWMVLEALPRTPNGKLDRSALPEPERKGGEVAAPGDPIEQTVVAVWREVLELEVVGLHDNFFDLGGHSLLATRAAARLNARLGANLGPRELFAHPTPAALAALVNGVGAGREAIPRLAEGVAAPLSFAQERLWFLDALEPGRPTYNLPVAYRLEGPLDSQVLARSIRLTVGRHDVLRTHFREGEAGPQAVIEAEAHATGLHIIDLNGFTEQAVEELLARDAEHGFDLVRGPLFYARLFRLDKRVHILFINQHHIIADGWSIRLLLTSIAGSYRGESIAQAVEEKPRYVDYADWQRMRIAAGQAEPSLRFWAEALAQVPPGIELPIDFPRPAAESFQGARHRFKLDAGFAELGRDLPDGDATPFMVYLTAFALLLSRYSRQELVCVGTPAENRERVDLEQVYGLFVNSLAMPVDLSGSLDFRQLLTRVRRFALDAYAHREVPFERVVAHVNPPRHMARAPLFQVVFAMEREGADALHMPGLHASRQHFAYRVVQAELTLHLVERSDEIEAALVYRTDLFRAETIARMACHLQVLMADAAARPRVSVDRLQLIDQEERSRLLTAWNQTARSDFEYQPVHGLFEGWAAKSPDAIALTCSDDAYTYAGLNQAADHLAARLRKLGVGPDQPVGLLLPRDPQMVIALLAVLKAGGAYLPLDPEHPDARLNYIVADAQPTAILTTSELANRLQESSRPIINIAKRPKTEDPSLDPSSKLRSQGWKRPSRGILLRPFRARNHLRTFNLGSLLGMPHHTRLKSFAPSGRLVLKPSDTLRWRAGQCTKTKKPQVAACNLQLAACYLIYTSGSTGQPKGVMVHHRGLSNTIASDIQLFQVTPEARFAHFVSFGFDAATSHLMMGLCAGAGVHMVPGETRLVTERLPELMQKRALTHVIAPASVLAALPAGDFPALRVVGAGAERVDAGLVARWSRGGRRFLNVYGPTEATITATSAVCRGGDDQPPIGFPIADTRVHLLDDCLEPVPLGVAGGLFIAGTSLARGYVHKPALTAARFIPDPHAESPGARLYVSGDWARRRADGAIVFLGRRDGQVKLRGFRVETGEIEAVLMRDPAVQAAAVTTDSGAPIAFVVGANLSAASLRSFCGEQLPAHMVPARIVVLPEMPLNPNGKIDYARLRADQWDALTGSEPQSKIERQIALVWCELLERESVYLEDDFFALGGHSLLATRAVNQLRAALNRAVPLRLLFENPVLVDLAAVLAALPIDSVGRDVSSYTAEKDAPLSFAQERLWLHDRLFPDQAVYSLPLLLRAHGPMDLQALEAAFTGLARRHDQFRARFITRSNAQGEAEPRCVIDDRVYVNPVLVDLHGLDEISRDHCTQVQLERETHKPFDLACGPLWRLALFRVASREHLIFLNMSHLIADGWSLDVLSRDFARLYQHALIEGKASSVAPGPRYADFAQEQRSRLQGPYLEQRLTWWRDHLGVEPEALNLPYDYPQRAGRSFAGDQVQFSLDADLTASLSGCARELGLTPFMLLFGVYALLLARYAGRDMVLLGTPAANREGREDLVGLLVNVLVVRLDFAADGGFAALAEPLKNTLLQAFTHQDVPFELVAPAVAQDSGSLMRAMFIFNDFAGTSHDHRLPGPLQLKAEPLAYNVAKTDLALGFTRDVSGRLNGAVEYNRDLFRRDTATRLAAHFQNLLRALLAAPHRSWRLLPLLAEAEKDQMLERWCRGGSPEWDDRCLQRRFEDRAARGPDQTLVVHEVFPSGEAQVQPAGLIRAMTVGAVNDHANRLARVLRARGVGRGACVGIHLERRPELLTAMLAVLKAGAAYVCLDPDYPADRLAYMIENARLGLLISDHPAEAFEIEPSPDVISVTFAGDVHCGETLNIENHPDEAATVTYTSGSTGRPKGVVTTHRNIAFIVDEPWLHPREGEVFAQVCSVSWDVMTSEVWKTLLNGARLCIVDRPVFLDPSAMAAMIQRQRIACAHITAVIVARHAAARPDIYQGMYWVASGGDKADPEAMRTVLAQGGLEDMINGYGPTEITTYVSIEHVRHVPPGARDLPIGLPIAGGEVYILDRCMNLVPPGVHGDLWLGGVGLTRGYLNRPVLTAALFAPHPFAVGRRLYRSGDRARFLANGRIDFLGRDDRQVKIRGYRVEPGEIEQVLAGHREIAQAAVIAREDLPGVKRLVAYLVCANGETAPAFDPRAFLSGKLPDYMVPAAFVYLTRLPLTVNGKLDIAALPAPELASSEPAAPRDQVEAALCRVWRKVLHRDAVGIYDNFFELGGDSILCMQLVSQAAREGLRLTPALVFQHQHIAALAPHVAMLEAASGEPDAPVIGPVALTPLQRRFFRGLSGDAAGFVQSVFLETDGWLDPRGLQEALQGLIGRHDALRSRFICVENQWSQEIVAPDGGSPLVYVDWRGLDAVARRRAADGFALMAPGLDLASGPMMRALYCPHGQGAYLFLMVHHLVVDGVSWRVLVEDLTALYAGGAEGLVRKTTALPAWTARLEAHAAAPSTVDQLDFWLEQDAPFRLVQAGAGAGLHTLTAVLEPAQTQALTREVGAAYNTNVQDLLLTAFVLALGDLSGCYRVALDMEGHGREDLFADVDLSRTVGWLTTIYPLVLHLPDDVDLGGAIQCVKETLRQVPDGGLGYGLLRELNPETAPLLAARSSPAVSFNYLGGFNAEKEGLFRVAEGFGEGQTRDDGTREHLLDIGAALIAGGLRVFLRFDQAHFKRATVAALLDRYMKRLHQLIDHCREPDHWGRTPSDFPLCDLSQAQVDQFIAQHDRIEDIYPMTPMQAGMVFHARLTPEARLYTEQACFTLEGTLDAGLLRRAWRLVVARHPATRTVFAPDEAVPLQIVRQTVYFEWTDHDWRGLVVHEREAALEALLEDDLARPFPLEKHPPIRFNFARLTDDRAAFVMTNHHAILDGWSLPIMLDEVGRIYRDLISGSAPRLAPAPRYGDYLAWLAAREPESAERYWRGQLAGFGQPNRIETAGASDRGVPDIAEHLVDLGRDQSEELSAAAGRLGVTLNTLFQGAWALLLSRYTAGDDVVFGATVSGRPAELMGVERMVGLFINTIPARVRVAGGKLGAWLVGIQENQREAREHTGCSLVQLQRWAGLGAGERLFETMLVFENFPAAQAPTDTGFRVTETRVHERVDQPLSLLVHPGETISLKFGYDRNRFDGGFIQRMADHLNRLLSAMCEGAETPITALSMLSEVELHRELVVWQDPVKPEPGTMHRLISEWAERNPDGVALVDDCGSLTYRALDKAAQHLAGILRARGVGPEQPVGVCMRESFEALIAMPAIFKAGGVYVPLDPAYPDARLGFMLADSGVRLLLFRGGGFDGDVPERFERLMPENACEGLMVEPAAWMKEADFGFSEVDEPMRAAYMIYTSGSTGRPKGVVVPHAALPAMVLAERRMFDLGPHDRVQISVSLGFDASLFKIFMALGNGATLSLGLVGDRLLAGDVMGFLRERGITHVGLLPSVWAMQTVVKLRYLRVLFTGGESPPSGLMAQWAVYYRVYNCYGPTETCIWNSADLCPTDGEPSLGVPVMGSRLYVLDHHLRPVPAGLRGELYIGGLCVSRGYHNRPGRTAASFIPNPFSGEAGGRMYRSGDMVRRLADGRLVFLGRVDHQVKIRGFRIETGEIEAVLRADEAISEAVVVVREDIPGDKRLVAYVVPAGEASSKSKMIAHAREVARKALPHYMVPSVIMVLDKIPLSAHNKLDRAALPKPEGGDGVPYVAPRTPTESHLAMVVAELLKLERVGVQDHFFELGGHSLLVGRLVSRLEERHQIAIPIKTLFEYPRIEELAQYIDLATSRKTPQPEPQDTELEEIDI